jgi:hypothetical protein
MLKAKDLESAKKIKREKKIWEIWFSSPSCLPKGRHKERQRPLSVLLRIVPHQYQRV